MENQNGGKRANKTIDLKPNEFISDRVNELPTTNGMHLIVAPTGAGKSHAMTQHSAKNNGAVIFPVKAVMQQQLQETQKMGINANIYQLEKFDDVEADKVDAIHFDECQLIYEGGFRADVERFTDMLLRQSLTKPVYCYSATYLQEIDYVKWDSITVYDKAFERKCNIVQVEKEGEIVESGKQIRQFRTAFASVVVGAYFNENLPTLVFINSKSKCVEIRDEILAQFPTLKVEISNSENNESSHVIKHIMETSTIAGCGADIILSTSSLEAGININDPVCIVSEQTEPGKLFQRFGRARKSGVFYVVGGSGKGEIYLLSSAVIVQNKETDTKFTIKDKERNTLSQYMDQSCRFGNRDHARACDRYSNYIEQCDSLKNSYDVYDKLQGLGYKVDEYLVVEVSDNCIKFKRGSKVSVCQCIREHEEAGRETYGGQLEQLIRDTTVRVGIDHLTASIHVQKYLAFKVQLQLVNFIKQDALTVFEKLSVNGQNFILSMSMNENKESGVFENKLMTLVSETIAVVVKNAGNVVMTGDKLEQWSDNFWNAVVNNVENRDWHGDDNAMTRRNLFRYLMGWVFDEKQNRWVIIQEDAWWGVNKLTRNEQIKKSRFERELSAYGVRLWQVCEFTKKDQKTLLNDYTLKTLIVFLKKECFISQVINKKR